MKSTTTTTTAFNFYLFRFAFTATTTTFALLRDVNGKILRNGGSYYIIPALKAKGCGGGLKLAKSGNETCPLTVVQAHSDNSEGLAARLSTLDRIGIISKGHLLNIEFKSYDEPLNTCVPVSRCGSSKKKHKRLRSVAKELDDISDGPFMILEHGDYYKLVYRDFV
ncbi:hypothetical protein K1719_027688 [Acacia pycnantha]|nr:hypothetical protein K1719_027688 [Acacia pycnantha]